MLRSGLTVRGLDPASVGAIAADAGVALSSLQRRGPALEEVFLDLVNGARVHASAGRGRRGCRPQCRPCRCRRGRGGGRRRRRGGAATKPRTSRTKRRRPRSPPRRPTPTPPSRQVPSLPPLSSPTTPRTRKPTRRRGAEAATDADAPGAAAFAVAGTGVIDIIPVDDETPDAATSPGDGRRIGDRRARRRRDGRRPTARGRRRVDRGLPGRGARTTSERPWEEYVKTESDEEADRFFASFDADEAAERRPRIPPPPPRTPMPPPSPRHLRITPDQAPFGNDDADAPPVDPGTRTMPRSRRAGRERTADRRRRREPHDAAITGRGRDTDA